MPAPQDPWVLQAWMRRAFGGAVKRSPLWCVSIKLEVDGFFDGDSGVEEDVLSSLWAFGLGSFDGLVSCERDDADLFLVVIGMMDCFDEKRLQSSLICCCSIEEIIIQNTLLLEFA